MEINLTDKLSTEKSIVIINGRSFIVKNSIDAVLRIKQRMYPGMIKDMRACIDAFYLMLDAKDAIHVKKMVNFSNWQEVFYSLVVASTGMTREEAEEYCCRGVKEKVEKIEEDESGDA